MSKKAIVLGGAGFIGSSVINALLSNGYQVENWDINKPKHHAEIWTMADITKISESQKTMLQTADLILHLAGVSEISKAEKDEELAYGVNVMGTLKLVKLLNQAPKPKLLFASSIYAEGHAGGVYGRTKKAAEDIIKSYQGAYQILRFGSVYGPEASKESGLVGIISQVLNSCTVNYPGDGKEIRNYIHVDDLSDLIMQVIRDEKRWGKISIIQGQDQFDQQRLFSILEEMTQKNINVTFQQPGQHNRFSSTPLRLEELPMVIKPSIQRDFYSAVLSIMNKIQQE